MALSNEVSLDERHELLYARRLPAMISCDEVAVLLGPKPHDIPVLVRARLLVPLGKPAPSAPKYFATCEVLRHCENPVWLGKAQECLTRHWKGKNERKTWSAN